MKLIIDIPEVLYKWIKDKYDNPNGEVAYSAIKNGIPYEERPQGDLISRSALKRAIEQGEGFSWDSHGKDDLCVRKKYIDNAPKVKFSLMPADESKDEAYLRGYEKGKVEGILKANTIPQGKWIHIGGDEWCCSECGHVITTEGNWETPLDREKYHCTICGADMRKGGAEE